MSERADRLRADLKVESLSGPARALAEEACLVLERLEHLDRTLQGDPDAWFQIVARMPPTVAEVVVNAPLAEARQQGLALKGLLSEYAKLQGVEVPAPPASASDDLAAKRAARLAQQG